MNKKLLALLNQINAQKQTVIDLANAGKLEEAKAAKSAAKKAESAGALYGLFRPQRRNAWKTHSPSQRRKTPKMKT